MALFLVAAASGQQPGPQVPYRDTVLSGEVRRGERFEAPFGNGLVFHLEPEASPRNPQGWTIRITPSSDHSSDYSMVATPPYRFGNPRYVNTAYGVTAEGALSVNLREFSFVVDAGEFQKAIKTLDVLLWPGEHSESEIAAAQRTMQDLPTYRGRFRIDGGQTSKPDPANPRGVIQELCFRAELCVPIEREAFTYENPEKVS